MAPLAIQGRIATEQTWPRDRAATTTATPDLGVDRAFSLRDSDSVYTDAMQR